MRTWTPGCPESGKHVVVRPNGPGVDFFRCLDCGRESEVADGRIVQCQGETLAVV